MNTGYDYVIDNINSSIILTAAVISSTVIFGVLLHSFIKVLRGGKFLSFTNFVLTLSSGILLVIGVSTAVTVVTYEKFVPERIASVQQWAQERYGVTLVDEQATELLLPNVNRTAFDSTTTVFLQRNSEDDRWYLITDYGQELARLLTSGDPDGIITL